MTTLIRKSGYRGYLPIETLASGRKDYNLVSELPKMRAAIAAAEFIEPHTTKQGVTQ